MFGRQKIIDVAPVEAVALQKGGAVLVDVREDDEWTAGHAPHAVHIPLGKLSESSGSFGGRQVLTVCRSGNRSARAAKVLTAAGVETRNVAGGMSLWARGGLPVVRDDGSPGIVA